MLYYISELFSLLGDKAVISNDDRKLLLKAHGLINSFPSPIKYKYKEGTYADEFANGIYLQAGLSVESITQFIQSLLGLALLQELPINDAKALNNGELVGFKSIEVKAYNKPFIEELTMLMYKLREPLSYFAIYHGIRNAPERYKEVMRRKFRAIIIDTVQKIYPVDTEAVPEVTAEISLTS